MLERFRKGKAPIDLYANAYTTLDELPVDTPPSDLGDAGRTFIVPENFRQKIDQHLKEVEVGQ